MSMKPETKKILDEAKQDHNKLVLAIYKALKESEFKRDFEEHGVDCFEAALYVTDCLRVLNDFSCKMIVEGRRTNITGVHSQRGKELMKDPLNFKQILKIRKIKE